MTDAVTIRTYEPRDQDQVWALHVEGVRETRLLHPDPDPKYEDDLRNIESVYLTAGSHLWVAEAAAGSIGMIAIQRIDARTGRVRRTRVTAAWRRRGLARQLLDTAETFCREQGYTRIILDTTADQTAAQALYEGAGFVRTGERFLGPVRVFDYEKPLT